MRRTWISSWLALMAAAGGWRCAIDDRAPKQLVLSERVPDAGSEPSGSDTAPPGAGSESPPTGAAGSGGSPDDGGASRDDGASPDDGGASPDDGAGDFNPFAGLFDPANMPSNSGICPAFDACGGALEGSWTYADVCVDPADSGIGVLQSLCPGASLKYEPGSGGTLRFAGGAVSRLGEPLGDSLITFPAACVQTLGCAALQDALGTSADCVDAGGDCVCRAPGSVDWGEPTYTVMGGRLLLSSGRSFDYCVQGDRLTYRETGEALEAGTHTLLRN